jgi:hypothetical protein
MVAGTSARGSNEPCMLNNSISKENGLCSTQSSLLPDSNGLDSLVASDSFHLVEKWEAAARDSHVTDWTIMACFVRLKSNSHNFQAKRQVIKIILKCVNVQLFWDGTNTSWLHVQRN